MSIRPIQSDSVQSSASVGGANRADSSPKSSKSPMASAAKGLGQAFIVAGQGGDRLANLFQGLSMLTSMLGKAAGFAANTLKKAGAAINQFVQNHAQSNSTYQSDVPRRCEYNRPQPFYNPPSNVQLEAPPSRTPARSSNEPVYLFNIPEDSEVSSRTLNSGLENHR